MWVEKKSGRMICVDLNADCSQHVVAGYQLAQRAIFIVGLIHKYVVARIERRRCNITPLWQPRILVVRWWECFQGKNGVHGTRINHRHFNIGRRTIPARVFSTPSCRLSFPSILVFMANSSNSFVSARFVCSSLCHPIRRIFNVLHLFNDFRPLKNCLHSQKSFC